MEMPTTAQQDTIGDAPKRLITLDILRGIALFGVTIVHISYKLYNANWLFVSPDQLLDFPFYVLILIGVLGFFGTWHGFFLFISSVVNSLVFSRKVRSGTSPQKLLIKNLIAGLIIVVMGYIVEGLGYFGYFGHAIKTGAWNTFRPFLNENFWIQTLQIIGLSLIINGIIQYFLLRNQGYKKIKRNLATYGVLAVCVLLLTPVLNFLINSAGWLDQVEGRAWPDIFFVGSNRNTAAWFLTLLTGPKQPLFPYLTSAFIGAMIGLFLGLPKPPKKWLKWFSLMGVGMIILGGLLVVFSFVFNLRIDPRIPFIDTGLPFSIIEEPPVVSTYLIRLGGQICLLMGLLALIEFRGKGEKFSQKLWVKYFRRWSMLSLTLYSLQILELLPRWILKVIFQNSTGINFMEEHVLGRGTEFWLVLIIIFVLSFFELVIFILLKFKMRGSLEWMFVKSQNIFSTEKSTKIEQGLLDNKVIWVNLGEIHPPTSD